MKIPGAIAGLLGVAMTIFAIMAWRELHSAATSELATSADSMRLTRLVYPQLFESANAGLKPAKPAKPADLAQAAFNRIYIIGGGSCVLTVVGISMLVMPQGLRTRPDST